MWPNAIFWRASPPDRLDVSTVTGIIGAALALRIICISILHIAPDSDYLAYFTMAANLFAGKGLIDPDGNLAYYNAGYPLSIYALWELSGKSLTAIRLYNVTLSCVSVGLLYGTVRLLSGSRFAAALAGLLWSTFLASIVYTEYVAKENLVVFLIALQIFLVTWFETSLRKTLVAALLGIAIGLQALAGNSALCIVPALLFALYVGAGRIRVFLQYSLVVVAMSFLVVAPWLYRNDVVIGAPVLNTNGGFNLYLGNNSNATGLFMSMAETPLGSEAWNRLRHAQGEYGADQGVRQLAISYMDHHPIKTISLAIKKAALFWLPPFHHSASEAQTRSKSLVRLLWGVQFCALVAGFAVFALHYVRGERRLYFIVVSVVLYTAVHMVFFVSYRFRLPVVPFLCIGTALALDQWGRRRMGGSRD